MNVFRFLCNALLTLCLLPVAVIADDSSPAFIAPSIEGTLFPLGDAPISPEFAEVRIDSQGAIVAIFQANQSYPNIKFPMPPGGWNLSSFGHVEARVTNDSEKTVKVCMRVDNAGEHKDSPWNTSSIYIKPGDTETLLAVFGQDNDEPGFPLDPSKVTGIQIFLMKQKSDIQLTVTNLRAAGSPQATSGENTGNFTTLADRDTPVTPPDWLGLRPPVDWSSLRK